MQMKQWRPEMIRFMRDASEHTAYNRELSKHIASRLAPESHICDAGCGLGYLSLELAAHAGLVTAVDLNPDALQVLRQNCNRRGIRNIRTLCGDIGAQPPQTAYDAMVFCFFGSIGEILTIARQQCRGEVFVIMRNYPNHRFSAGIHPHKQNDYAHFCQVLSHNGIPFDGQELDLEFGQPLRSLEDARLFYETYTNDSDSSLITDEFLRNQLHQTGLVEFPYYLPHTRKVGFLHWSVADKTIKGDG